MAETLGREIGTAGQNKYTLEQEKDSFLFSIVDRVHPPTLLMNSDGCITRISFIRTMVADGLHFHKKEQLAPYGSALK